MATNRKRKTPQKKPKAKGNNADVSFISTAIDALKQRYAMNYEMIHLGKAVMNNKELPQEDRVIIEEAIHTIGASFVEEVNKLGALNKEFMEAQKSPNPFYLDIGLRVQALLQVMADGLDPYERISVVAMKYQTEKAE